MNTNKPQASHVNTGTSIPREELAQPTTSGPVMRLPKTHVEIESDTKTTPYGGLVLVTAFLRHFAVSEQINENVSVLKQHQPYTESDHVLAQAVNLYVGGTCIEDMANLQQSEAVCRMLGACRVPDPTTAGDFLRRFDDEKNPGALAGLRQTTDQIQCAVWESRTDGAKKRNKKNKGRIKDTPTRQELAVIDIDGHTKEVYGATKEGADFNHKGKWSYQPLVVTLAGTGECLAIRNRPGNVRSSEGAAEVVDETIAYVRPYFKQVLVRGDSDFDRADLREVCHKYDDCFFAFVGREFRDRPKIAEAIPEEQWRPFETRAKRRDEAKKSKHGYRARRKRCNRRRQRARERGYKELRLVRQWIAEVPWTPSGSQHAYRLVIRRQLIEHHKGQTLLFKKYRYRYVVTNLPMTISTARVIDLTYERCDQENVIEQLGSGLAAWRMPVGEFAGNSAWLEIARLAWNLAKWLAQLVLPEETVRWEWKRFRQAFVYLAADIIKRSRQIWVRFSPSHRFLDDLVLAHQRLQC